MASRFQSLSMVFDMMDTSSGAAWDSICIRLETLDEALDGYRDLLEAGRQTGKTVAARQVRSVVEQGRALAGETSAFANLVAKAERTGHGVVVDRLVAAITHAKWAVAEGWALYAERLMLELGYFERPDYVFGMLAKQLYRATRVVVDIGLHLGLTIPAGAPIWAGEAWSFELATEYLRTYGFRTPDQAVSETMRYLGWPGQAIAYKLGEREILSIRAEAERRRGVAFDLKAFHDQIIGNGAMRLDLLREVVLQG